jgi:hypothetical protein
MDGKTCGVRRALQMKIRRRRGEIAAIFRTQTRAILP